MNNKRCLKTLSGGVKFMTRKKLRRYLHVLDTLSWRYLNAAKDKDLAPSLRDYYQGVGNGYHFARDILVHGEREPVGEEDC
jgi:hypothetical protein